MKKSSYALFVFLGLILAGAFLFPAVCMKRLDFHTVILGEGGPVTEIRTGRFTAFALESTSHISVHEPDNRYVPLEIELTGSDTLTAPVIEMDSLWRANTRLELHDGKMCLYVTGAGIDSIRRPYTDYFLSPDAARICRISVPEGMLREITGCPSLNIHGLRQPSLAIRGGSLRMTECDIAEIEAY